MSDVITENDYVWRRMPRTHGTYWFIRNMADRHVAQIVGVERITLQSDETYLRRTDNMFTKRGGKPPRITEDQGWWLRVHDERMTATVEETPKDDA